MDMKNFCIKWSDTTEFKKFVDWLNEKHEGCKFFGDYEISFYGIMEGEITNELTPWGETITAKEFWERQNKL